MAGVFEAALTPVMRLSIVFGVLPLKKVRGATYVFSWPLFLYTIFVGLASIGEGVYFAVFSLKLYYFSFSFLVEVIAVFFLASTWLITVVQFYRLRYALPAIFLDLEKVDARLATVTYKRFTYIALGTNTTINGLFKFLTGTLRMDVKYLLMQPLHFLFTNIPIAVGGQYAILMHIISRQLINITEKLRHAHVDMDVRHLLSIHNSILCLAERINDAFNIFLFQIITTAFVMIVLMVYMIIASIVHPGRHDNVDTVTNAIVNVIVCCSNIVLMVSAGKTAMKSADRFNAQLFNNVMMSNTLAKDITVRTYLAMQHRLKQTACEFFSLDYPLLTSMAAGATTYVILLVQFTVM